MLNLARRNHRGPRAAFTPEATFRLRIAAAIAAVLLVGMFVAQTTSDAWKLADLENRLHTAGQTTTTASLADPERLLQFIPPGDIRNNLLSIARSGKLPNFTNEQEVQAYLAELAQTAGTPVPLPSWNELHQAVLKGRTAVLQTIDSLVAQGNPPHEP